MNTKEFRSKSMAEAKRMAIDFIMSLPTINTTLSAKKDGDVFVITVKWYSWEVRE